MSTPTPAPARLTINILAQARGLAPETLKRLGWVERPDGVAIPWPLLGGGTAWHVRHMLDKVDGRRRWSWQNFDRERIAPLGYDRLARMREQSPEPATLVIAESEIDAAGLWSAGIAALATAGADMWRREWWQYTQGFGGVAVWMEDAGTLALLRKLAETRPDDAPPLYVCHGLGQPGGAKDPGRILASLNGAGHEALRRIVAGAVPVTRAVQVQGQGEDELLAVVAERLSARRSGSGYEARCPFHSDDDPSLSVFRGADGWGFRCHSGSCGAKGPLALLAAALGIVAVPVPAPVPALAPNARGGLKVRQELSPTASGAEPTGAVSLTVPVPAPPFPLDCFPAPVREFLDAGACSLDCPPEFVAVPFLAEAAAAIGNQLALAVTRSWLQTAQVWVCTVGEPGTAKSPAAELAGGPLDCLQRDALARWREALAAYENELAAWQAARKDGPPAEKPERPEPEHFFTSDATIEGLMRIIAHPHSRTPGLVVRRDELVGWVKSFDAYKAGRGGERQTWLTLWTGRPVKVDRAGRDPYFCARPCVSVSGSVQPDMLPQLEVEAGARDGLLERVLWAWPDARPMRLTDVAVAGELLGRVTDVLARLRRVRAAPPPLTEAEAEPLPVPLSLEARALFESWHNENCEAQERVTGLLRGYYAKLPSQAARLCLILHALAHPDAPTVPVSAATMRSALELAEYFRAHAHRVFARFGVAAQVQDSTALRLYRALQRLGGSATAAELDDAGVRAGPERDRAVQTLTAAGLLTVTAERTAGPGRPTLRFALTGNFSNKSNFSAGLSADDRDGGVGFGFGAASPGAVTETEQERWEEFEL
jgi:hypothetical protein